MEPEKVKYVCACRLKNGTKHLIHIGDCEDMDAARGAIMEHLPTTKTILVQVPHVDVPFEMDPQTA